MSSTVIPTPTPADVGGSGREHGSGRRAPRRRAERRDGPVPWILLLVVGGFVLPPMVVMLWKSLVPGGMSLEGSLSTQAYGDVFSSDAFVETLVDTTIFVAGSTVLAMTLALGIAWLVVRTDAPVKWVAYLGVFLGIATPGIVSAIGWLLLFGGEAGFANTILADRGLPILNVSTMVGMIVVEALRLVPMSFLFLIGPMRSMNDALEEAGMMSGASSATVLRRITAPVLLPALLGSGLLSLIWAIQAFEIPLILGSSAGISIFTAEIYEGLHNSMFPDYAVAAAYGAVLVLVVAILIWTENRVLRQAKKFQVVTGKSRTSRTRPLGRWRWLGGTVFIGFTLLNLLPVIYTVLASFSPRVGAPVTWSNLTLKNYAALRDYRGFSEAVLNSLVVSSVAALAVVAISFVVARWVTRNHGRFKSKVLEQLAAMPLVIPNIVLSLGFLLLFLYAPLPLYGTMWMILIAYVAHYLPYGMRYLKPALMSVGSELEEAAQTSGATDAQSARRVMFPLVRPAAIGVGTYIFSLGFRELSLPALLVTAGTPMVSTMLLRAIGNGDLNIVGAMGTVMLLISMAVAGIAYKLLGTMGQEESRGR